MIEVLRWHPSSKPPPEVRVLSSGTVLFKTADGRIYAGHRHCNEHWYGIRLGDYSRSAEVLKPKEVMSWATIEEIELPTERTRSVVLDEP